MMNKKDVKQKPHLCNTFDLVPLTIYVMLTKLEKKVSKK